MRSGTKIGWLAAAAMVAALWASPVEAGFFLKVSETEGRTTTSRSGVAVGPGSLAFVGLLPHATLDASSALELVTPDKVYADLSTLAEVLSRPHEPLTLTVTMTLTDLTLATGASPTSVDLTLATAGTAQRGESVSLIAALDTHDLGRTKGKGVSALSFASGTGTFSTSGSPPSTSVSLAGVPLTHPFSLSLVETIKFTAPGVVQLNSSIDPSAPEPSTLVLVGGGLSLLGFGRFCRRKGAG